MPAAAVKPGQEKYWERAKKQAEKQGRGGDWAYVMGIFQRMIINKSLEKAGERLQGETLPRFIIRSKDPGQVPSPDALEAMRLANQKPAYLTAKLLERDGRPRPTPQSVVEGLPVSKGERNDWITFLKGARGQLDEPRYRQQVLSKLLEEKHEPVLRRVLADRAISYWRTMHKAYVVVHPVTPRQVKESLEKAGMTGGKYYMRVPREGGAKKGYTYYYDADKYHGSKKGHVSGDHEARKSVNGAIEKRLGDGECGLKEFQTLIKRYGSKLVGDVVKGACEEGRMVYKSGKLKLDKGERPPTETS